MVENIRNTDLLEGDSDSESLWQAGNSDIQTFLCQNSFGQHGGGEDEDSHWQMH